MTTLWLLGAGGLLGSAVGRAAVAAGQQVVASTVPWDDPAAAVSVLDEVAAELAAAQDPLRGTTGLRVAWCAGAGVVGSSESEFDQEAEIVEGLLSALSRRLSPELLASVVVFVASSAGAVYAGGGDAPHDEFSATGALVPYGRAKLRLEQRFREFAQATGARVVLGRIANLYGPGQRLGKGQGLVSTLLTGALTGSPVKVYVDLDTVRDYLFVDDAAHMVLGCLDLAGETPLGSVTTKVIASGVRVTVSHLLNATRRVGSQRPLVVLGSSPLAAGQVRDLSLRSRVWPELDAIPRTPLLVGVHRTFLDLQRSRIEGRL